MDLIPEISFFACASSWLSPERNLPASCKRLASRVISNFVLARAPKPGGTLTSCAASGASAKHKILMPRGIDSMDLLLYELQLGTGNPERQQHLLFGHLPLGADAPLALEFESAG